MIPKGTQKAYQKLIDKASKDFNQVQITWLKSLGSLNRDGEDSNDRFSKITLNALANYNYNRVWPVTGYTDTGEIDKESEVIIFNLSYLKCLGYLNENDNFIFDPATDYIIHKGIKWKCSGMTNLSQAFDKDLLVQLVLQRENPNSHEKNT